MNPQSSRSLNANAKDGIVQISNVVAPIGTSHLKIRWKVSYRVGGELIEESGENSSINVS
jgi:hypothetical protein